ncbi:MAG TPA: TonB-dependent receptor [Candidatus Polarisedimenticolia bacterium]|nr:TonB-dependent receptor [Candidatus Polarisedimenticolia bacterium]
MPQRAVRLALLTILACVAGPVVPSPALGADTAGREIAALGPESAPLLALPLSEAPGATTVITAAEIERSGAANIFDLLRRVPGVDIRYTPMGGHIGIRGAGASPFSEQVLLLIDGSPYNSPDKGGFPGHPNYTGFFPLDRIARIEIIKGPISVLYGANAFGGVINIVSKQAADAVVDKIDGAAFGATLLYGEHDTLDRRLRAALVKDGWDATLEAGASDGDTPIHLNGDATHKRMDIYGAVRRGNVSGSILHQESDYGSFPFMDTRTKRAYNSVDILDGHYERRLGSFVLRGAAAINMYRGTTCAVCHNNMTGPPDDAHTSDVAHEYEVDQRARLSLRLDRTLTDAQDLVFGVEGARDSVERDIVKIDEAPVSLDSGGAFVQHQWRFQDGSMHLLSGMRLDGSERLGWALSPRLTLVDELGENIIVRASLARAFRAPTWNERFRRQRFLPEELFPGTILVFQGETELERERNDSVEAGLSWRMWPKGILKVDLYYNRIDSFIQLGPSQFVPGAPNEIRRLYENRDDTFAVRGGEVALIANPANGLSLSAGYAYRDLTLDTADPASAYAPRSRATLSAGWSVGGWDLDLTGSHSSSYTVSSPEVFGVRPQSSYELFDAAVHRSVPLRYGTLRLGLVGRNLFDQNPRETLINEEIDTSLRGRVIALEVKVDF